MLCVELRCVVRCLVSCLVSVSLIWSSFVLPFSSLVLSSLELSCLALDYINVHDKNIDITLISPNTRTFFCYKL